MADLKTISNFHKDQMDSLSNHMEKVQECALDAEPNKRELDKLLKKKMESGTWKDKCDLEYKFGISSDNDARDGANSGEAPMGAE